MYELLDKNAISVLIQRWQKYEELNDRFRGIPADSVIFATTLHDALAAARTAWTLQEENERLRAACQQCLRELVCDNAGSLEQPFAYFWRENWLRIKADMEKALTPAASPAGKE